MAVTRAEKEQELQELTSAFKAADTAILVDYHGLNVPRSPSCAASCAPPTRSYRVVKNTLAMRASKGTAFEVPREALRGHDRDGLYRRTTPSRWPRR